MYNFILCYFVWHIYSCLPFCSAVPGVEIDILCCFATQDTLPQTFYLGKDIETIHLIWLLITFVTSLLSKCLLFSS